MSVNLIGSLNITAYFFRTLKVLKHSVINNRYMETRNSSHSVVAPAAGLCVIDYTSFLVWLSIVTDSRDGFKFLLFDGR